MGCFACIYQSEVNDVEWYFENYTLSYLACNGHGDSKIYLHEEHTVFGCSEFIGERHELCVEDYPDNMGILQ